MLAVLGLGSNIEPAADYLEQAIKSLRRLGTIIRISTIIKTAPVDYTRQADFLNCVLVLETQLSPQKLLTACQKIENKLGRVRLIDKGPRTIDIDILLYKDLIINTSKLVIPHPELAERQFVLISLVEICPDYIHPLLNKSMQELFNCLAD